MAKIKKERFYIDKKKGVIVARLWNKHGVEVRAKASCVESDEFNEGFGKELAELRARQKYLQANRQRYLKKAKSLKAQENSFHILCEETEKEMKELYDMEKALLESIR